MKNNILTHVLAAITVAVGIWLVFSGDNKRSSISPGGSENSSVATSRIFSSGNKDAQGESIVSESYEKPQHKELRTNPVPLKIPSSKTQRSAQISHHLVDNPEQAVSQYIAALRNSDGVNSARLWSVVSQCEACLLLLVDMIINEGLENDLMLKLAARMTELDTNTILPVYDVMIDPARNSNEAIVLTEKLMKNGKPEFVRKILEVILRAQENGYQNFAQQLIWVVTKLQNHEGIEPILDLITGRLPVAEDYAKHVSSIFSKTVYNIPEPAKVAQLVAEYYTGASPQEQERMWEVVSRHPDALVLLAVDAEKNGQLYSIRKFATSIAGLPNEHAVDGLMKLHISVEHAPEYLANMMTENVTLNPTVRKLHKLEDYMRDPDIDIESRFFAAEGLLAVRGNRHARYILEKVINNTQYADPELQAYIGGRL